MAEDPIKITKLINQLAELQGKLEDHQKEIQELRKELYQLKLESLQPEINEPVIQKTIEAPPVTEKPVTTLTSAPLPPPVLPKISSNVKPPKQPKKKTEIEKFVGENLIGKIGIAIIIIGVGIFAKYAIDHQMINPVGRIAIGYIIGIILAGLGIWLKKKYKTFSAVLLSGSVAIAYFITYFAQSLYGLMPLEVAFSVMFIFTMLTVFLAVYYKHQVIAHIGLIGAYAVPFLLGGNSNGIGLLFVYTAIVNIGILTVGFIKNWKGLTYSSFAISWLMYFAWYVTAFTPVVHFTLALPFLLISFGIFYVFILMFTLVKKEKTETAHIVLLILNASLVFGLGYNMIWVYGTRTFDQYLPVNNYLVLFILANAGIHFIVSVILHYITTPSKSLFNLTRTLAIVFITLAIPIQLNENWILLAWGCEALILFAAGIIKKRPVYEAMAYPVMILLFIGSIVQWVSVYQQNFYGITNGEAMPVINVRFLTGVLCILCFSIIVILQKSPKYISNFINYKGMMQAVSFILPAMLITVIYYTIRCEISTYFEQLHFAPKPLPDPKTKTEIPYENYTDFKSFKILWITAYSLVFAIVVAFINMRKIKSKSMALVGMGMSVMMILTFLTFGLYHAFELRYSYTHSIMPHQFKNGVMHIGVKYICLATIAGMLATLHIYIRQAFVKVKLKIFFEYFFHLVLFWMLSSEVIYWMDGFTNLNAYKLGLSILWGIYSLFLISIGIGQRKLYLRITGFIIFACTLIKLFAYDISNLDTISKTIIFIALGALLLIISFLYIKYRGRLAEDKKTEQP
jgi:hypothetical protein